MCASGWRLEGGQLVMHAGGRTFEEYHSVLMQWPLRKPIYIVC